MVRVEENKNRPAVSPGSFLVRLTIILPSVMFTISPTALMPCNSARSPSDEFTHPMKYEEKLS